MKTLAHYIIEADMRGPGWTVMCLDVTVTPKQYIICMNVNEVKHFRAGSKIEHRTRAEVQRTIIYKTGQWRDGKLIELDERED